MLLSLLGNPFRPRPRCAIGLAEDPDILDPTLARTYVGRIVFSAVLRQAVRHRREAQHRAAARAVARDRRPTARTLTIKLRPGVKFHDGEPFDAEAAKFSMERHLTLPGLVPQTGARLASTVSRSSIPSPSSWCSKAPFSPLIAQLTDRAGMMVSPKAAKAAGDKFGLHPVCAGPYKFVERVQQDRMVFEKFADYWNKDNIFIDRIVLPADRRRHRAPRQSEIRRPRPDRARARDRHQGGRAPTRKLEAVDGAIELGYQGVTHQHRQRQDQGPAQPVRESAAGARPGDRPRGDQPGRVQRRVHAGQPVGQPGSSLLPEARFRSAARRRQEPRRC